MLKDFYKRELSVGDVVEYHGFEGEAIWGVVYQLRKEKGLGIRWEDVEGVTYLRGLTQDLINSLKIIRVKS